MLWSVVVACSTVPVDHGVHEPESVDLGPLEARVAQQEKRLDALQATVDRLQREVICREKLAAARPEPAGRDYRRIPGFGVLVTDAVVRQAVRETLRHFAPAHATYSVSYAARHGAFEAAARWGEHELYHDSYEAWRLRLLDVARAELADPDRLMAHYRRHRGAILEEIRTSGRAEEVRRWLADDVRPSFEPSPELRAAVAESSGAYTVSRAVEWGPDGCAELAHADHRAAEQRVATLARDPMAAAFLLRREAEGGPELVDAWRQILDDVISALEG